MHSEGTLVQVRDAKLDSVCLDAAGFGKLIDMGCAKMTLGLHALVKRAELSCEIFSVSRNSTRVIQSLVW